MADSEPGGPGCDPLTVTSDLANGVDRVLEALRPTPGPWLVAVSGGPDSIALLHLLATVAPDHGMQPVVGHVDHGIHPDSASVAALVERHAVRLGLPYRAAQLALGAGTTETAARARRYEALERLRRESGAHGIITAHHAGDQGETVLMRVLRGSGPAGLAGMSQQRGLVRPLLQVPARDLAAYADAVGLEYWRDPANDEQVHLRNWVRATLLPLVRERLPDIDARLADVAHQAAGQREAWDSLLDRLPGLDLQVHGTTSVATAPWLTDDTALARQLLVALGRRAGCHVSSAAASRALAVVRRGASGRRAELGGGWCAELAFGRLVLRPGREAMRAVGLSGEHGVAGYGGWRIEWRPGRAAVMDRSGYVTWITKGPLEAGGPEAGDRLVPLGFTRRRSLSRLLQEARVPAGDRPAWLVLRRGGEVIWAPGVCRSAAALPAAGEAAIEVSVARVAAGPGPAYASPE